MEFPETLPDRERTGRQEGEPSSVCHPDAGLSARGLGARGLGMGPGYGAWGRGPKCAGPGYGAWVRGPPARIVNASPRIIARRSYRSPFVQSLVRTAIEQLFCNTM